ncbi:flagellar hook-length control protein FliK [Oleisolibacter albus]|uniref:flagellar hook-length control protein FliK n=1 Tax=Oleisolibacter albus TaxID=2171757 RepID=UPI00138FE0F9|nr:flagellar hook-length control protein FliK [Oleisolibacter albus]
MDTLASIGITPSVPGQGPAAPQITAATGNGMNALFTSLLSGLLTSAGGTPAAAPGTAGATTAMPGGDSLPSMPEGLSSEDLAKLLTQIQGAEPAGADAGTSGVAKPGIEMQAAQPQGTAVSDSSRASAPAGFPISGGQADGMVPVAQPPALPGSVPRPPKMTASPVPATAPMVAPAASTQPAVQDGTEPPSPVTVVEPSTTMAPQAGPTGEETSVAKTDKERAPETDILPFPGAIPQPPPAPPASTIAIPATTASSPTDGADGVGDAGAVDGAVPAPPAVGGDRVMANNGDNADPVLSQAPLPADGGTTAEAAMAAPVAQTTTVPPDGSALRAMLASTKGAGLPADPKMKPAPETADTGAPAETAEPETAATAQALTDADRDGPTGPQRRRSDSRGPLPIAGAEQTMSGPTLTTAPGAAKDPVAVPPAAGVNTMLSSAVAASASAGGGNADTTAGDHGQTAAAPTENTASLAAAAHDPAKQTTSDFAQHLTATRQASRPGATPPPLTQMAVHVQRAVQDGTDRLSIQLRPADLGRVDVRLEFGKEGQLRAQVMADNPYTLDLLQKDAKALERALQDVGLTTDSSSLSFSLRDDGQPAQQNRQESGGKDFALKVAADVRPDEMTISASSFPVLGPGRVDVRI